MKKVVFICRGNMFRSQYATAIYNQLANDGSVAEGYGTAVEQEGREGIILSSYPEMNLALDKMKKEGMDISGQHCHQITPQALEGASKIILMSEPEYVPDWLKNYEYEFWEVPNPVSHTPEIVDDVYNLLYKNVSTLLSS
jgi:protein-tyrosine-phosphatase